MDLIANDPLDRKTFAYEEDNWDSEMNANLEKTVDQANDIQRALFGDAAASTLDSYSEDTIRARINQIESGLFTTLLAADYTQPTAPSSPSEGEVWADTSTTPATYKVYDEEAAAWQTDIVGPTQSILASKVARSTFTTPLIDMGVGMAADSTGSRLDLWSGTNLALEEGDELIIFNPTSNTSQTATVSENQSAGTNNIALSSSLSPDVEYGEVVLLAPANMRQDPRIHPLQDILYGANDPAGINTNHETRLQNLAGRIDDAESRLRTVAQSATQTREEISEFEGAITNIRTTAQDAALEASTLQVTDQKLLRLTTTYDGSADQTALDVEVNPNLPAEATPVEILAGDILAVKINNENGVRLVTADSNQDSSESPITSLPIKNAQTFNANSGAGIYLTSTSIQARVSARTNGNVNIRGDQLKSVTFNGSVEEDSTDGYHYIGPLLDDNGDPILDEDGNEIPDVGDSGWTLTSGGDLAAGNAYIRGQAILDRLDLDGKLGLGVSGSIVGKTPESSAAPFHLSRKGLKMEAEKSPVSGASRSLTFTDIGQTGDLARMQGLSTADTRKLVIQTYTDDPNRPSSLQLTGNTASLVARGTAAAGNGTLTLDGQTLIKATTPAFIADGIPEAAGPDPLIDQLYNNEEIYNYFSPSGADSAAEKKDLASKLKGLLWADTGKSYRLRYFHPSQYPEDGSTSVSPDIIIRPDFKTDIPGSFIMPGDPVTFTDDTYILHGKIVNRSWDFTYDGSQTNNDVTGARSATWNYNPTSFTNGTKEYTVQLTVEAEKEDGTSVTEVKRHNIVVKEDEPDPPDLDPLPDPPDPPDGPGERRFRHRDDVRR